MGNAGASDALDGWLLPHPRRVQGCREERCWQQACSGCSLWLLRWCHWYRIELLDRRLPFRRAEEGLGGYVRPCHPEAKRNRGIPARIVHQRDDDDCKREGYHRALLGRWPKNGSPGWKWCHSCGFDASLQDYVFRYDGSLLSSLSSPLRACVFVHYFSTS